MKNNDGRSWICLKLRKIFPNTETHTTVRTNSHIWDFRSIYGITSRLPVCISHSVQSFMVMCQFCEVDLIKMTKKYKTNSQTTKISYWFTSETFFPDKSHISNVTSHSKWSHILILGYNQLLHPCHNSKFTVIIH